AGYQQHPFTYFSLEKNPVREPKDLIGKTVATNGTARILLQALLAANGIPEDQVEVLVMGADMSPLLTGQGPLSLSFCEIASPSSAVSPPGSLAGLPRPGVCGARRA
ncbi:ABC transporter substrate-binding protein, partial [Paracoccus sp. APAP_BH8]